MTTFHHLNRRSVLATLAATALPTTLWAQAPAKRRAKLVLAGPPASVSNALVQMVDSGAWRPGPSKCSFCLGPHPTSCVR